METCYKGVAISTKVVEACGGDYKSADCILTPNALTYLSLPVNSSQSEINAAVQASLMAKDELIGEIPVPDGSETKIIAGDNVTVTGTGTPLDPYVVEAVIPTPADSRPYKVYTALMTQSGTDAPVPIILENTLGDIVWTYDAAGTYTGTLLGAFTDSKTVFLLGNENTFNPMNLTIATLGYGDVDTIYLANQRYTKDPATNNLVQAGVDSMIKQSIEIRVYN